MDETISSRFNDRRPSMRNISFVRHDYIEKVLSHGNLSRNNVERLCKTLVTIDSLPRQCSSGRSSPGVADWIDIDQQGTLSGRSQLLAACIFWQAFAFVLQAIQSPPPRQAWHDAAKRLDIWSVEYEDVLRSIPETDRKPQRQTPYTQR